MVKLGSNPVRVAILLRRWIRAVCNIRRFDADGVIPKFPRVLGKNSTGGNALIEVYEMN